MTLDQAVNDARLAGFHVREALEEQKQTERALIDYLVANRYTEALSIKWSVVGKYIKNEKAME